MKKIKYTLFTCLIYALLASIAPQIFAQGENNNWHFGNFNQISFNGGSAEYNQNSAINTFESSAAVSDANGELLFYTMGTRIWDRFGEEMPNATGLLGNGPFNSGVGAGSGRTNVHIVPHPGNHDQYIIFSAEPVEMPGGKAYYHIVDMSLHGGRGDVVPGMKNIEIIEAHGREAYTVTRGICGTYWFIGAMNTQPASYYAFRIDENGVSNNPVVTFAPQPGIGPMGQTEITSSGITVAVSNGKLMMAHFNKQSGTFSNFQPFGNEHPAQYIELSPNQEKFYAINYNKIGQYNISSYPDVAAIAATSFNLAPASSPLSVNYEDLRQAPDGNLYAVRLNFVNQLLESYAIDRINNPDGSLIGFSTNAIPIPQTARFFTFGSKILPRQQIDTIINAGFRTDTTICPNSSITLHSPYQNNYSYYWNNGSTASQIEATQSGTYWVISKSNTNCVWYIDTFKVRQQQAIQLDLGNDTTICKGNNIHINLYQPLIDHYSWNDGYTGAERDITEAGTYIITAQSGACTYTDTITVKVTAPYFRIIPEDTVMCIGDFLVLRTESNMENQVQWDNGATTSTREVNAPGTYTAIAINYCGQLKDSVKIDPVNCNCQPQVPTAFTPNNDGKNDQFIPLLKTDCQLNTYELNIYNRYGTKIFHSGIPGNGWNGNYPNQTSAETGVYFYTIKLSNSFGNTAPETYKGQVMLIR